MSDDEKIAYAVRMPRSMLERIRQSARQSGIPVNREMIRRLSHELPPLSGAEGGRTSNDERTGSRTLIVEEEARRILLEQPALADAIAQLMGSAPAKTGGLTIKQSELLDFMRSYAAQHNGIAPTYDEIMIGMGIGSKSTINRLMVGLEERGYITRMPGQARSIKVI